jgi:hypothetical protein
MASHRATLGSLRGAIKLFRGVSAIYLPHNEAAEGPLRARDGTVTLLRELATHRAEERTDTPAGGVYLAQPRISASKFSFQARTMSVPTWQVCAGQPNVASTLGIVT